MEGGKRLLVIMVGRPNDQGDSGELPEFRENTMKS
jgi:hypothetical protein